MPYRDECSWAGLKPAQLFVINIICLYSVYRIYSFYKFL